jgi:hypothetical protein
MISDLRKQMPEAVDDLASFVVRSGKWAKLAPEAKEGLVPDATMRASLDANHAAIESGTAPIKAAAQQTIDTSAANIAASKKLQAQQQLTHDTAVAKSAQALQDHAKNLRDAQEAQKAAQEMLDQIKESVTGKTPASMGITSLLKSQVAGRLGDLAMTGLGIPDPIASGLKLAISGAPLAKYGINVLRRNPMVLGEAARGGVIAGGVQNKMAP